MQIEAPRHPLVLDETARHLLMRGDAAGARALLEQAVAEDPSQAAIWPAHSGVSNTRLIEHLPLIVPPGCGFRVGAERREWHTGNAFIFDDTFEHEAWNDSDEPRAVLILDIWNPHMTEVECEMVRKVTADVGEFYGTDSYREGAS